VIDDPLYVAKALAMGYVDPATGLGKSVAQMNAADRWQLRTLSRPSTVRTPSKNLPDQGGVRGPHAVALPTFGPSESRKKHIWTRTN